MSNIHNAYALVVGISHYLHVNKLPEIVLKDAKDIYNLLIDPHACGYSPENVQLLLDEQASLDGIMLSLAELAKRCDKDATVFIYVSSHGGRIESGSHSGEYLLPVDANNSSEAILAQTSISGEAFTKALQAIPARKMVTVLDCCRAGGIGQPKDALNLSLKTGLSDQYYVQLASGRGRVIFASSRSSEFSYLLPGDENSLFTKHLLGGLRGEAPGPGGVIRVFDLFDYVQPRVTQEHPNQHPIFKAEVEENFPVAFFQGGKTPQPVPVPDDDFAYDLFVSYRHQEPDKKWVRKTLVPKLEEEGLRVCIDYKCFALGRPLVLEMARAIEESRYTLAILSPTYLKSNFTELENVLAEHLGLEKGQYRLLTVIREDCTPRLGMRANLMLDMTEDDEFESNLARLIFQLRQSPER